MISLIRNISLLLLTLFLANCNNNRSIQKDAEEIKIVELSLALEGMDFPADSEIWKTISINHRETYKITLSDNNVNVQYCLALVENQTIIIDTILQKISFPIDKPEKDSIFMMASSMLREKEHTTDVFVTGSRLINLRINSKRFYYYEKQQDLINKNMHYALIVNKIIKLIPRDFGSYWE